MAATSAARRVQTAGARRNGMRVSWQKLVLGAALGMVVVGCGKKKQDEGGGGGASVGGGGGGGVGGTPAPSKGREAKLKALEEAFAADANCQLLVACCAALPGTPHEQMMKPICGQVTEMQNFAQRDKDMVDVSWQTTQCKNTITTIGSMVNASNPLPAACQPH
jgi:hypothetical protein